MVSRPGTACRILPVGFVPGLLVFDFVKMPNIVASLPKL